MQLAREAAERERILEAAAVADRERTRLEAEAAEERERSRVALEAADRERLRLEAEATIREAQLRQEADAERAHVEAAAAVGRRRHRKERAAARDRESAAAGARPDRGHDRDAGAVRAAGAAAAAHDQDPFADFRDHAPGPLLELMPVAGWATPEQPRPSLRAQSAAPSPSLSTDDELRELIAGLALPVPVASVRYARGCRIRRVRVPAAVEPALPMPTPVILSRRALADMRTAR